MVAPPQPQWSFLTGIAMGVSVNGSKRNTRFGYRTRRATMAASVRGCTAQHGSAKGEWRSYTEEQSLLAVSAISWHMKANAKETLNAHCAEPRPSRSGSGAPDP
jgi:hypothetical protein